MEIYPAKYTDEHGEVETTIRNDWKILRMDLRGVEFSGSSFDYFGPDENMSEEQLKTFTLNKDNELSDFQLDCKIPVKILENIKESEAILSVHFQHKLIEFETGFYDYNLALNLNYKDQEFYSTYSGDFEDCFGEISNQLKKSPNNLVLKCCFGCRLSDYSVYGHAIFGSLICFKNLKREIFE